MTDETTPQGSAAMPPASAGSRGDQCRCGLTTRLVGDGCEHCNPTMMIDILREQVAEMRLTDEELEAIANGASSLEAEAMREGLSINAKAYMRKHAATLRGLLARFS